MNSSLDNISTCGDDKGGEISSNKKVNTSCDQKDEHCNNDGVDHNTSSNSSSGIDTVSDCIEKIGISNDDDDELFQDPPPKEDCPICLLPMPFANGVCGVRMTYMSCCGKMVCTGCMIAAKDEIRKGNMKKWCAFCRLPLPNTNKEELKRIKKRIKLNDAQAYLHLGHSYGDGGMGLPQDFDKGLDLMNRAAELGSINARYNLGSVYHIGDGPGDGVERDMDKAIHHYKLAAMGGHERARHILGMMEHYEGNNSLAMKHFMISARAGEDRSLKAVGEGYKAGHVTKDEYAATLRAYQVSIDEMKSDQRHIAAERRES